MATSERCFLDSNVLLYTLTEGDPRQAIAAALLARGGTISVQVLNEFASVAHRKLKLSWPEVADALAAVRALCPAPLPLTLARQTGYALYDALILASAIEAGCDVLYSEDMQDSQVIEGRLTIRNPFRTN